MKFLILVFIVSCGSELKYEVVESEAQATLDLFQESGNQWGGNIRFSLLDVFDYSGYESVVVCHNKEILINRDLFLGSKSGVREPALLHGLFHCSKGEHHREGTTALFFDRLGNKDWFPASVMTKREMIPEDIYLLNRNYYLEELGL